MKAIRVHRFGGPEVLTVDDLPDPVAQPGEVVVRVRAAGVNPYDTYMRAGNYGARNPALPYTPGSDAAGVVEALGSGVNDLKVGDRVYTAGTVTGAYAEKARVKRDQVHTLPETVSFSQGAGVWVPYATAYRSLFQLAHARPGETVLVHGASGGVGIAAMQFARSVGLRVIGTAGSREGLDLVAREGATVVVNHRTERYQQQILDATGGAGVDVILEMLANVNLGNDLKMLASRGRVVVIGSRGDVTVTPRDLMGKEGAIFAVQLWLAPAADVKEIHAALQAGLASGALKPIVGAELPLSGAPDAHRRVIESTAMGKTVLVP
jgi:NADPH2:quinone reductase